MCAGARQPRTGAARGHNDDWPSFVLEAGILALAVLLLRPAARSRGAFRLRAVFEEAFGGLERDRIDASLERLGEHCILFEAGT